MRVTGARAAEPGEPYFEQGQFTPALAEYQAAAGVSPNDPDRPGPG